MKRSEIQDIFGRPHLTFPAFRSAACGLQLRLLVCPVVALLTLVATAGCTPVRYEYTAPATADGRACADQCAGARQLCENRARIMDRQCHALYQVQMTQYSMCRQSGRRPLCVTPDACPGPNDTPCIRDFNDCFADCGGQVHEIEVKETGQPR